MLTIVAAFENLVDAIVAADMAHLTALLSTSPDLALAAFPKGKEPFLAEIERQFYSGDTALHIACAAHSAPMAELLIRAGAGVRARNRRGCEPLHAASSGSPGSPRWNPAAQAATIMTLLDSGADPNAPNTDGATSLHRAVRTRCAEAVRVLLNRGADRGLRNKGGSTALDLALHTTGRSGSGSPEAKAQQQEILRLLRNPGVF